MPAAALKAIVPVAATVAPLAISYSVQVQTPDVPVDWATIWTTLVGYGKSVGDR